MPHNWISVRGARVHNLKDIDVDIPRDKLVVITGLSGSGKSSLAFDTLYAEGQRRYVESLSAYARQFLEQMEKPDVDLIEGLSPAISIEQKTTGSNPRSTVGTVTEIYDYLRLLFANIGVPHCPNCGREIASQSLERIVDLVMTYPQDTRINVLAPIVRGRKGEFKKELQALRTRGFTKARIDGQLRSLEEDIALDRRRNHNIDIVIDRLIVRSGIERRLQRVGRSGAAARRRRGGDQFAGRRRSPVLAQAGVRGVRHQRARDVAARVLVQLAARRLPGVPGPGRDLGFRSAAHRPGRHEVAGRTARSRRGASGDSKLVHDAVAAIASYYGIDPKAPFGKLPKKQRDLILLGPGAAQRDKPEATTPAPARKVLSAAKKAIKKKLSEPDPFGRDFEGVIPNLRRRFEEGSWAVQEELDPYRALRECPVCNGNRLRAESLVGDAQGQDHRRLRQPADLRRRCVLFDEPRAPRSRGDHRHAHPQGDPGSPALPQRRRRRLPHAGAIGGHAVGRRRAAHPPGHADRLEPDRRAVRARRAVDRAASARQPQAAGDARRACAISATPWSSSSTTRRRSAPPTTSSTSGPAPASWAAEVIFQGLPADLIGNGHGSLTGAYLGGEHAIETPKARRKEPKGEIVIRGARANNLKDVDVKIPLGRLVAVTGVSGSGKSTLVNDILYKSLAREFYRAADEPGAHDKIEGINLIDKVIEIDQSPIGRTPRSNPATYTSLFTFIRELFAMVPEARTRGFKPGRFSFNVKGGRCEACQGDGVIAIEMHFLPNVYVTCEQCKGRRYNRETLEIKYRGKSIADVLDLTVDQALPILENFPPIATKLRTLQSVGLGYITLGQSATTLSGGEAQRVKLSRELSKRGTGRTLYILDEPTTGLHFEDVRKLLDVLMRLVDQGNTIVVIEHNLDVIKSADWMIDLGPEGGEGGGRVVAQGTPEQVAKSKSSATGHFLAEMS